VDTKASDILEVEKGNPGTGRPTGDKNKKYVWTYWFSEGGYSDAGYGSD